MFVLLIIVPTGLPFLKLKGSLKGEVYVGQVFHDFR